MAYDANLTDAEVLVGLDVLRLGRLMLNGPSGEYELFLPRAARPVP